MVRLDTLKNAHEQRGLAPGRLAVEPRGQPFEPRFIQKKEAKRRAHEPPGGNIGAEERIQVGAFDTVDAGRLAPGAAYEPRKVKQAGGGRLTSHSAQIGAISRHRQPCVRAWSGVAPSPTPFSPSPSPRRASCN